MVEMTRWEQAQANHKEAQRLLNAAQDAYARGDVPEKRVGELKRLRDIALEDLHRCEKDHRSGLTDS
jgi:hypothetical protein